MTRRIALVFSGGPAPAANAVINAAAMAIRRAGAEAIGIRNGYTALMAYDPDTRPLVEGADYFVIPAEQLRGMRNERGVVIGTARAHPGRLIRSLDDLDDPARADGLRRVCAGLRALGVDGLISIGGDGTLRTANMLWHWQDRHVTEERDRVRIVHVPKTIDNDYRGIDFTFGFFTAVDTLAAEILNLRADALATSSWFIVECMGRRAGWLAYGAAIAGEAHMVIGVEDLDDASLTLQEEVVDAETGASSYKSFLDLDALAERIVGLISRREAAGKPYGIVVIAEGLVERLPPSAMAALPRDVDGSVYGFAQLQIGRMVASRVAALAKERLGASKKVTGLQIGYESRCAPPHAFDVILGCQLGYGAASALLGDVPDGIMVSVTGQMELRYLAFDDLLDPKTMTAEVRYVDVGSDFHRLAHSLGSRKA